MGPSSPSPRLSRDHVVVCLDDEVPVLSALRRLLRYEPYQLRTTTDPGEALRWVQESEISLVISDHRMPAMTGIDLLRKVRQLSSDTVRVILTGYPDDGLVVRGMEDRAVEWLIAKPWNDAELRTTVRRLLFEHELRWNPCLAPEDPSTSILPPRRPSPPPTS